MQPSGSTRTRLWLIVAGSVALVAGGSPVTWSAEPAPQTPTADAGLTVRIDPETGTYSMPPPGTLVPAARNGAAAATEALVITPGTSPAGGFKATRRTESLQRTEQP